MTVPYVCAVYFNKLARHCEDMDRFTTLCSILVQARVHLLRRVPSSVHVLLKRALKFILCYIMSCHIVSYLASVILIPSSDQPRQGASVFVFEAGRPSQGANELAQGPRLQAVR